MDPLTLAAVAGPIVGGIIGNIASSGDRNAAAAAAQKAYQMAMSLGLPPDLSQQVVLQQFKSAGMLSPQMEDAVNLGISQVSQIKEDPTVRNAQAQALQLMQQRGQAGLTATDRQAFNQMQDEVARDAEGKRQQIAQNFMARGQGGSGAELMAQLQQAQSSSNQMSNQGDQIASQASQNALKALGQSSDMANQLRSQDFNVNNTKAQAADAFSRFNVENQIARQQRNVASANQAQQYNLGNQQQINNANTQQANQEALRENQAKRDYWNDQLQRTQFQSNAALGQASNLNNQANATAKQWSGVGSGVGAGAGAIATSNAQNNLADIMAQNKTMAPAPAAVPTSTYAGAPPASSLNFSDVLGANNPYLKKDS